ncbi:hypothetical protein E2P71_01360 [Candidatus Bathyarchaeota archaeon]|nr:hypothetical protein E2P71_01360 [Candidatus Bathyarchaeota archaeon]
MILNGFNLNSMSNRIMLTGALYVAIFAFGFVLTRFGSPYNTILLNIHKFASLGAIYLLYRSFNAVNQASGLNTLVIALGIIAGITFLGIIATGGLISIGGNVPEIVYTIHHLMPVLNMVAAAASLYLLNNLI